MEGRQRRVAPHRAEDTPDRPVLEHINCWYRAEFFLHFRVWTIPTTRHAIHQQDNGAYTPPPSHPRDRRIRDRFLAYIQDWSNHLYGRIRIGDNFYHGLFELIFDPATARQLKATNRQVHEDLSRYLIHAQVAWTLTLTSTPRMSPYQRGSTTPFIEPPPGRTATTPPWPPWPLSPSSTSADAEWLHKIWVHELRQDQIYCTHRPLRPHYNSEV